MIDMSELKRSLDERLQSLAEMNQHLNIQTLETDDQGRFLLDRYNPHHVAWYEDYDPELI